MYTLGDSFTLQLRWTRQNKQGGQTKHEQRGGKDGSARVIFHFFRSRLVQVRSKSTNHKSRIQKNAVGVDLLQIPVNMWPCRRVTTALMRPEQNILRSGVTGTRGPQLSKQTKFRKRRCPVTCVHFCTTHTCHHLKHTILGSGSFLTSNTRQHAGDQRLDHTDAEMR